MKEVIKKELETPFNTMRKGKKKKKRHLNYILPPSDKGNLTYLLSQSLENRERSPPPPGGQSMVSHKLLVHRRLLCFAQNFRRHSKYLSSQGSCPVWGWQTSQGAQRPNLCQSAGSTGPFATSCQLPRASRGNSRRLKKTRWNWPFSSWGSTIRKETWKYQSIISSWNGITFTHKSSCSYKTLTRKLLFIPKYELKGRIF